MVRQWLASLPSGRGGEYEMLLDQARQRVVAGLPDVDAPAALADLHERMAGPRLRLVARRPAWRREAILVAAACLVVAAGAVLLRQTSAVSRGEPREYVTAAAQREKITLADGTELTLAPASRLRFPADYGRGSRDVYLEGEAFFAVRHDAAHPFAVHAGGAVARDVGTRFDVRAYADDRAVRVAVAEGEVAVGAGAGRHRPVPGRTARAGDAVVVSDTAVAMLHGADIAELTAWTDGRLVFRATPLREVVRDLGRWYDLDVRVDGAALGERTFSGSYTTESAEQVLSLVTAAVGARYERHGRTVTIR